MEDRRAHRESSWNRRFGGVPLWVTVVALGALAAMVIFVVWDREQADTAPHVAPPAVVAPSASPVPIATAHPTADARLTRVVVVSDSYTAGSTMDSGDEARWPALIGVEPFATSGVGYVQGGSRNFVSLAENVPADATTVLFFGSINDTFSDYDEVRLAADAAFGVARENAPGADLIVIGPPWVNAEPSEALLTLRDAVSDAAVAAGATWVDPIAEEWFVDRPELIGTDGIHPTDEGHAFLAEQMSAILAAE